MFEVIVKESAFIDVKLAEKQNGYIDLISTKIKHGTFGNLGVKKNSEDELSDDDEEDEEDGSPKNKKSWYFAVKTE